MYKHFFFFLLFLTTVILPTNVFGFNQVDDKTTYIGEKQKDQIGLSFFGFITVEENYIQQTNIFESDAIGDLNLRWEPYNSFLGDDF